MQTRALLTLLLTAGLTVAAQGVHADGFRQIDSNAILGGAIGGGAGAAVGSAVGGRNGAIIGSAVGAATGVAIATPGHRHVEYASYEYEDRHHDHGYHRGHRRHHHGHHDHDD